MKKKKTLVEVKKDPRPTARLCPAHRLRLKGQIPPIYTPTQHKHTNSSLISTWDATDREMAHNQTVETALQLIQHVEKDTFDDSSAGEMH